MCYTRDVLIPVSRAYCCADFCGHRVNCFNTIAEEDGFVDEQELPDVCFCTPRTAPSASKNWNIQNPNVHFNFCAVLGVHTLPGVGIGVRRQGLTLLHILAFRPLLGMHFHSCLHCTPTMANVSDEQCSQQ